MPTVSGRVILDHGLIPTKELTLRVVRRDFGGGLTVLKETKTKPDGSYSAEYPDKAANFEIHVVVNGVNIPLSRPRFAPAEKETMDLLVPGSVEPPEPEFNRLRDSATPFVDRDFGNLASAVEHSGRRDFSVLSGATGWDARLLGLAADSLRTSKATALPVEAVYGLARAGFPTDPARLAQFSVDALKSGLEQAVRAGVVKLDHDDIGAKLEAFVGTMRLQLKLPGTVSSPKEFVDTASLDSDDRDKFEKVAQGGTGGDIWDRATAAGVSPKGIAALKLQGKLAYLTLNNAPLTKALTVSDPLKLIAGGYHRPAKWKSELDTLAGADPARRAALIPPAFSGPNVEARLDAYCDELARRVQQMDPRAVTVSRLTAGELDGLDQLDPQARGHLAAFFKQAPTFRLGTDRLGTFIKGQGADPFLDIPEGERAAARDNLRSVSALYAISPSDHDLNALLRAGFRSATEIAALSLAEFVAQVQTTAKPGDERINEPEVYWKAQQTAATVFNIFDGMKRLDVAQPPPGLSASEVQGHETKKVEARKALVAEYPTLESLFGTVDFCDCTECQSVLSAAAYLVDILRFLDPTGPGQAAPAFAELNRRRPDIAQLQLSCANTNTSMPYIDEVNEVLEQVVATALTTGLVAHDTTGEDQSADLIAEPRHLHWEAYEGTAADNGLRGWVYPTRLPFDLPLEMVRTFAQRLGSPLWKLRETMLRPERLLPSAPGLADSLADVWLERIGIGPRDLKVLTSTPWHLLYGCGSEAEALKPDSVGVPLLQNAKRLARRLDVSYVELTELFRTRFVNPGIVELEFLHRIGVGVAQLDARLADPTGPAGDVDARLKAHHLTLADVAPLRADPVLMRTLRLAAPNDGCDFAQTTIRFDKSPTNPDAAALALRRLNVFVRLRRVLGWEIHELDRALTVLVPLVESLSMTTWADRMTTGLINLAHLAELFAEAEGRVTREELLCLWTNIPTVGVDSLYGRLFETAAVSGQTAVFTSSLGRVLEAAPANQAPIKLATHLGVVRQAFGLSHQEIEQILSFAKLPDADLSLANISLLFRHRTLAAVVDCPIDELLSLLTLSSKDPFTPLQAGPLTKVDEDAAWNECLGFLRELRLLKNGSLTIPLLRSLCLNRGAQEAPAPDTDPVLLAIKVIDERSGLATAEARDALTKALAVQLSVPEALLKFTLEKLTDSAGAPLIGSGFGPAERGESVGKVRKAIELFSALGLLDAPLEGLKLHLPMAVLNELPASGEAKDADGRTMFAKLRPWFEFASGRQRFGSAARLIAVLTAARQPIDAQNPGAFRESSLHEALGALLGRPIAAIKGALAALGWVSVTGMQLEAKMLQASAGIEQLADILSALDRLGLEAGSVMRWISKPIDKDEALELRSAVKATCSASAWRSVARPMFDELRRKRRDALVARLIHLRDAADQTLFGETEEQLFERLLLDPGTQPVVLASRIQLAIASVQLFVRRCLMGLEGATLAGAIDAHRWEWMCRYRVWEVNRKFYLWPENWLDPEFRDDKTHLFRDLEGALLKGDVNDDLVRTALQQYLVGLQGIARLELLTMYFEAGMSPDGGRLHVVGRTPTMPFKYFSRSCAQGMWTPWEPIDHGLEGDHVVLTRWRGRLHLFWVGFLEKPLEKMPQKTEVNLGGTVDLANFGAIPRVQLQLNWIENIQGKWVNRSSTAGFEDAPNLDGTRVATLEQRRELSVHAMLVPRDGASELEDVQIHVSKGKSAHCFELFSKLAAPRLKGGSAPAPTPLSTTGRTAGKWKGSGPLSVTFKNTESHRNGEVAPVEPTPRQLLQKGGEYRLLLPSNELAPPPREQLPPARGRPSVVAFRPQDAVHFVYRGVDGQIHDQWGTSNGWFLQSPSRAAVPAVPGDPPPGPAEDDPSAYCIDERGQLCIVYRTDTTVVELSWNQNDAAPADETLETGWTATELYRAPDEAGRPVGRPLGGVFWPERGCVFRTKDGRLIALRHDGSAWKKEEEVLAGAPKAATDPSVALVSSTELAQRTIWSRHLAYVGDDGQIHALELDAINLGAWKHTAASSEAAAPGALVVGGGVSAYSTGELVHVVYRAADNRVTALHRFAGSQRNRGGLNPLILLNLKWQRDPISATIPDAVGNPVGVGLGRGQLVTYRSKQGLVALDRRGQWTSQDLTAILDAPVELEADAGGVAVEWRNVAFFGVVKGANGPIEGLKYNDGQWKREDLSLLVPFRTENSAGLIAPFFYEAAGAPHTFFVQPFLVEKLAHTWTEWIVTTDEYFEFGIGWPIQIIPFIPDRLTVVPSVLGTIRPLDFGRDGFLRDDLFVHVGGTTLGPRGSIVRPQNLTLPRLLEGPGTLIRPRPILFRPGGPR